MIHEGYGKRKGEFGAYMLFALVEVFCVFLPVAVHGLVILLMEHHKASSLFDQPDLLYAAIVLPAIAVCKYLFAYFTSDRVILGARLFARVLCAGFFFLLSGIVLGLFFGASAHGTSWSILETLLALCGVPIFLVASSDYFNLTHAHPSGAPGTFHPSPPARQHARPEEPHRSGSGLD